MSKETDKTPEEIIPFWKQKHRHAGRPKLFESPEMMLEAANEYFEVTAKRFWNDQKHSGGKIVNLKISPPFTILGFCLFIGASRNWWNEFRSAQEKEKDSKFLGVIRYISDMIEMQQIEGAAIGAFNGNIISRMLGLVDKKETEVTATVFKVGYKKPEDDGE